MTMEPWAFGEPPLPAVVELAEAFRELTSTVLSLERDDAGARARWSDELREAQERLAPRRPPTCRPRVGEDRRPDRRVYIDHSRDIGELQPVLPALRARASTATGRDGTVEFPIATRARPGSCTAGSSRCSSTACCSSSTATLGVAGKTADAVAPLPPADAVADTASTCTRERVDRRTAASARTPSCSCGDELLCEARDGGRGRATATRCPTVSPRRAMSAPTTRRAAVLRAPRRRAARRRLRGVRRRAAHLRRRRARSRVLARGLLAAGSRARQPGRAPLPDRRRVRRRVAGRGAHRRGRRADQHVLDADELRDLLAAPTSTSLLGVPRVPRQRLRRRVGGRGRADLGDGAADRRPRPFLPRALARRRLRDAARGARRRGAATRVLDAIEDDVTPADRMVIVHTSGSTARPRA